MMQDIDPRRQMVVDRRTCDEIKDALAVDLDANQVRVRRPTFSGDVIEVMAFPEGIRVVRRR